jgi:hypothetical protein
MRALVILWRLGPLVVSFIRDYRRWIVGGGPVTRTAAFHERRAARMVVGEDDHFVVGAQLEAARDDVILLAGVPGNDDFFRSDAECGGDQIPRFFASLVDQLGAEFR